MKHKKLSPQKNSNYKVELSEDLLTWFDELRVEISRKTGHEISPEETIEYALEVWKRKTRGKPLDEITDELLKIRK